MNDVHCELSFKIQKNAVISDCKQQRSDSNHSQLLPSIFEIFDIT